MKKNLVILAIAVFIVTACGTSNTTPTQDIAAIQTSAINTAWAALNQTATANAPISTPTTAATATTAATPTPADTPTSTIPPPPTANPLFASKQDGFYLINVDIAPGVWRSTGTGDSCYWKVSTRTGDIIDNHFGMAGGTAYIPEHGFEFQIKRCGTLEYLGPP